MTKYMREEIHADDRRLSRRRFLGNAAAVGGDDPAGFVSCDRPVVAGSFL